MKKTSLKKRAKAHTQPWHRKEAVKIAKLISKHRDNYTCVTCGKSADQGYQIHGSHILPESKFLRLSCEPLNIMSQCARCHMDWHEHPKGQGWFEEKFPTRLKELLKLQAGHDCNIIKPDFQKITKDLKEQYNSLIN